MAACGRGGTTEAARSGSGCASYCRDVLHSRPPMAPSIFITIIKRTIGVTIGCDYAIALIPDDCCTQLSRFPKAIAVRNDYYLQPLAFSAAAPFPRPLSLAECIRSALNPITGSNVKFMSIYTF